jgi:hypothetical protein
LAGEHAVGVARTSATIGDVATTDESCAFTRVRLRLSRATVQPHVKIPRAAYAMNLETYAGSLEAGKWAGLIVIDHNPLASPLPEVYRNAVQASMIAGVVGHFAHPPNPLCRPRGGS